MNGKVERLRRELAEAEKEAGVPVSGEPVAYFYKHIESSEVMVSLDDDEVPAARRASYIIKPLFDHQPHALAAPLSGLKLSNRECVGESFEYDGGDVELSDVSFTRCHFEFVGPAANTVMFLRAIRDLSPETFATVFPDTQPHALAAAQAEVKRLRDQLMKAREEMACCNFNSAGERLSHALSTPADTSEIDRLVADAGRYRLLRRGQRWSVINGIGDTLRGDDLDAAIDAARAEVKS